MTNIFDYNMKLLLTSGGFTNATLVQALVDLSEKPLSQCKLVFVPTAANMEPGDKCWLIDDLQNCKKLGCEEVDIVDFTAMPKEQWLPRFQNADILMFGGGNTYHLIYSMRESGLEDELLELLKSRIYVGISAGSMVTAHNIELSTSAPLYLQNPGSIEVKQGLGYVDFQVRPHFNSQWFPDVNSENLAKLTAVMTDTLYALDDQSAIKIDGDSFEVVTEGTWEKFN